MEWVIIPVLYGIGMIISGSTLWLSAKITRDKLPYYMALIIAVVSGIVRLLPYFGFILSAITILAMLDKLCDIDWFPHGIFLMIVNIIVNICLVVGFSGICG